MTDTYTAPEISLDERLREAKDLLTYARDHIMGFIGSSYSETDKEDEAFVDEINAFLGEPPYDWRNLLN
jgi:hypothetical protein